MQLSDEQNFAPPARARFITVPEPFKQGKPRCADKTGVCADAQAAVQRLPNLACLAVSVLYGLDQMVI
jgi:hypothetical protein